MTGGDDRDPFGRLELLVGRSGLNALAAARVIVFGVGGVGSWCAEALARSGIGHLTLVDPDDVCATNINRQLQATAVSVGKSKVDEITKRLREINPEAQIVGIRRAYNWETNDTFELDKYDYVIDAIDSLSSKVDLIMKASAGGAAVFSALGAANKIDPARVRVSSIWKSEKCRLGRFVRKRLRRWGFKGDLLCVWSDEGAERLPVCEAVAVAGGGPLDTCRASPCRPTNKSVNGSFVGVTGVFGFMLSSLVIQDIINKANLLARD